MAPGRRWVSALLVFAAFSLLALAFTSEVWIDYMLAHVEISWKRALAISSVDWYLWALLTPIVSWLGGRFPIGRRTWWYAVVIHAPLCLILLLIKQLAESRVAYYAMGMTPRPAPLLKLFVGIATYFVILGVAASVRHARERREQEVRTSQLETDLARAQLDALKMRLHPHFLFNTLNGISALMREDVEAADLMLTRLSDLLRLTLDAAGRQETPLSEELAMLDGYLKIQAVRFGARLTIRVEPAADTLTLAVPNLVLQPLVENALQHGAGVKPGPATVVVRAVRRGTALVIEVEDDGPGPPTVIRPGYGLDTTRARLQHLYGASASLSLERVPSGGAIARLEIPVH